MLLFWHLTIVMANRKRKEAPPLLDLGRRERQIMEVVYRLGSATVGDVLGELDSPPSYSAVRTMLGKLEEKGLLRHRIDGPRYVYVPIVPVNEARATALERVVNALFGGSTTKAMSALLDQTAADLNDDELGEIERLIRQRRREGT